ncbi:TPM domain-containing protein [Leptospira congkakensis]|uniref:TPM domain-containing protein n=1 Tax=Leptospira congkakensis TaxID=2484932 RepID=A0A4Z1AGV1_9LEPT|nr:TPM domain-containing protein [Leptospira congkakensis]TGL87773.1 TPM domain-containing protein [Leptospira congkakensis]TGL89611.1 TPM domain-containing protein [Leptospira congkakensis]TGL95923.1 TPM domain-containing protein [Leptospira congkakensis]
MKLTHKNWIFIGIFYSLLFSSFTQTILARDVRILTDHLTDEVGILSLENQNQIINILSRMETKTSAQMYVYVIPSLEGENLESYSVAVAEKSKLGQKDKDNGVLVLLSTGDRKVRIEVGYGLEETLTDVLSNRIIRNVMIPEFKKGEMAIGLVAGVGAIETILYGDKESNPALSTDYPNGIGTALSNDSTPKNFAYTLGILLLTGIIYYVLKENDTFKGKKWLEVLYGFLVFSGLCYFFPDALFYLFCLAIVVGNLYLLYGIWSPLSYLYSFLSIAFWIPFLHFTFKINGEALSWVIGCLGFILLAFKITLDDVIKEKFNQIAKGWGMSSKGLFLHILSFLSFGFSILSFGEGKPLVYIVFYQGLILFTIYGLGFRSFSFKPVHYFIALVLWLSLVSGLSFYWQTPTESTQTKNIETMVIWFQWFHCFVGGYILAKAIEVDSWKYRFLKYLLISFVWTLGFSIHSFLGYSANRFVFTFLLSYVSLLILHFLYIIANESRSGSDSSYSSGSSSSSSSYSSSGSSSSSSSSSGGGGGSFGGGGSSGSW